MKNQLRVFAALSALTSAAAFAYSGGISSASFNPNAGCNGVCHSGGLPPTVALASEKAAVNAGESSLLFFTITQASALQTHAGLNLKASAGTLAVADAGTQLMFGEITHLGVQPLVSGQITFSALWTSPPSVSQTVTFTAWGNNVNFNGLNDGDRASTTTAAIVVTCVATNEVCDGVDNDCNSQTDEGQLCPVGQQCVAAACEVIDAGTDAGFDAGFDGGFDAGFDGGVDAGFDGGVDAGVQCGPNERLCNGQCASLTTPSNCGGCGITCTGNNVCSNGACTAFCAGGQTNCSGSCQDLQTSATSCGSCGQACSFEGAAGVCRAGVCQLGACNVGNVDLDKDPSNGCECSGSREEICNGFDDDCDGEVDEIDKCDAGGGCGCSATNGLLAVFAALGVLELRRRRR